METKRRRSTKPGLRKLSYMTQIDLSNSHNTLQFKLAKLMIALAWADGSVDNDELNVMKDMLRSLENLTAHDWAKLEIFMERSIEQKKVEPLIFDVINAIRSNDDKQLILNNLKNLIAADGTITNEENEFFAKIKNAIENKNIGNIEFFTSFVDRLIKKGIEFKHKFTSNEDELEEYIHNKILFDLKNKYPLISELSRNEIKKWSAAAGLLGRVAICDGEFSNDEKIIMVEILKKIWGLNDDLATMIGEVAKKRVEDSAKNIHQMINYYYLANIFYEESTNDERVEFIKGLFHVANATDNISFVEIETIRGISLSLRVSHDDFIKAKLFIMRQ